MANEEQKVEKKIIEKATGYTGLGSPQVVGHTFKPDPYQNDGNFIAVLQKKVAFGIDPSKFYDIQWLNEYTFMVIGYASNSMFIYNQGGISKSGEPNGITPDSLFERNGSGESYYWVKE